MQFDFTLQPNKNQHLDVSGTFLKYTNGTGKIRVRLNGGGYIDLMPGQGVSGVQFNNVDLQDRTGFANTGTILAGMYNFQDDNVYGTVTVRDSSADIVQANKSFISQYGVINAGNGVDSKAVLLYNPANSGKIVKVKKLMYTAPAGLPANFYFRTGTYAPSQNAHAASKLAGGAQSVAVASNETVLAANVGAMQLLFIVQPVLTADKYEMTDPIVLPPGVSLAIMYGDPAATQSSYWNIEFTEE